jgi:hypothetical protein
VTLRDLERRQALRPQMERLAQLLASADGARIAGLLQDAQLFWHAMRVEDDDPSDHGPEPDSGAASDRIGIWRANATGALVRERSSETWSRFADVAVIPPRGTRRRVVLFGESVARGYLYDPVLTFAGAVEAHLRQHRDDIEVVDLASTGAGAGALVEMLGACDILRPDAIVVFAGNNWVLDRMPALFRRRFLNAWLAEGAAAAQQLFFDELLAERVDETIDACVDAAQRQRVPLVFVLPEFNLAGFTDCADSLVPALDAGGPAAWVRLRDEARAALAQGAPDRCEARATEMLQLDRGLHPTAYHLLARCALARGDAGRAYELLGRARDAQCGLPIELTPRCPAPVQERVRRRSETDGFDLVDLPRSFAAADQSPGRELFLDYCHLSLAGIERAARSVAAQLRHRLDGRLDGHPPPRPDRADGMATQVIQIAPIHEATAHFLAGVHNAHVGAPMEIVSQRFDQALRICSDVGRTMLEFLDFRNRRKPDWMCASFDAACESPLMRRYLSSLPRPWQETLGDVPLFRALEQALERHGVDAVAPMEKVRRAQSGRSSGRVNVLAFHGAPVLLMSLRRSAFLACYQQQERFHLIAREPGPVRLRVTWRVPAGQPGAPATIRFNGIQVGAGEVRDRWSSVSVEVAGELVRAGTNDIEIRWPPCDGAPAQPERLELDGGWGIPPRMFHVFGELQRLTAELSDPD